MRIVRETGRTLFGDNCAACHGGNATGGNGYPDLTDASWLWGGDPDTIAETLRVGINSLHNETRVGQMLAFGRDQMLPRDEILNVTAYVQSLSDPTVATGQHAEAVRAGQGDIRRQLRPVSRRGWQGSTELGAPDLTDRLWLYGGDRQSIFDDDLPWPAGTHA